jgi:hypothetical protein
MSTRRILVAFGLFSVLLMIYCSGPISNATDSRQSLPTLVSLQRQGNFDLNEYYPDGQVPPQDRYLFVCTTDEESFWMTKRAGDCAGRLYSLYPSLTFVAEAPFFFAVDQLKAILLLMEVKASFLGKVAEGDYLTDRAFYEVLLASMITASATVFLYLAAANLTTAGLARSALAVDKTALWVALIFALGTSAWSTASRALWTHSVGLLLTAVTLFLALQFGAGRWSGALTMALCVFTVFNRPAMIAVPAALAIWLLAKQISWTDRLISVTAGLLAVGFLLLGHQQIFQDPLPPYYRIGSTLSTKTMLMAGASHLFSASRGLFIFSPILLAAVIGVSLAIKKRWQIHFVYAAASACVGHWFLLSLYPEWWAGHSYGPRYMTDILPLLCLLLVPVLEQTRIKSVSGVLMVVSFAWSALVHGQAAYRTAPHGWNLTPVNVDFRPDRVWNFRDPQWARGWSSWWTK